MIISCWIISKDFKIYITINDLIGEARIDLSYPINGRDGPTEGPQIAVVSMLSDNVQYWLKGPMKILLKTGKEIVLMKAVYTDKELNALIGLELKSQMTDS